jgi:tetratricopeptide (TPR) repeat protein
MGLGLLDINAKQFGDAKAELRAAVAIAEKIAAHRTHKSGRQDLIEAHFQLGRAHSFAIEYPQAAEHFRKMQDLASRWVSEEPKNLEARDLLAASYRKLGDLKKFSKDFGGARQDYRRAIDIGRQILKEAPLVFAFKQHLGIGVDDLAGVARAQGQVAEARTLYREAEQIFSDLVEADPENLEPEITLLHTQINQARMEEAELQFGAAATLFRRVLDRVSRLKRDGALVDREEWFANTDALTAEIAKCDAALRKHGR